MLSRVKPWETLHALVTRVGTNKLTGQTALIVGARGESLALARKLAAAGCKLALCSADPAQLVRARRELEASGCAVFARVCDTRDAERVAALVQAVLHRFGSLDILVTCAESSAAGIHGELEEAFSSVFWTAYHPTMAVLPHMLERKAGRIVHIRPAAGLLARSSAAGEALRGFSRGLRRQLSSRGVDIRITMPGRFATTTRAARRLARTCVPDWLSSSLAPTPAMTSGAAQVDAAVSSADLRSFECFRQVQTRVSPVYPASTSPRAAHAPGEYTAGPSTLLRAALGGSGY